MTSRFVDFLRQDSKTVVAGILLLVLGAILKDFLPFAWRGFIGVCAWLGRRIGGRFAFRYFERTYLDWLVTQLRELKLTGIVTSDATKKPRLEQVFVTLRVGGEKDEVSFMDCAVAVCNEIRRNPRKGGSLLEALRRDLERAPAEQRKEAEEYITRSVKHKKISKGLRFLSIFATLPPVIRHSRSFHQFGRSILFRMSTDRMFSDHSANESDYLNTLFNQTLRENRRLAILGSPGSGKSTLLQYIGLAYAKARAGDAKLRNKNSHRQSLGATTWRLPVFIPLSTVSKSLAEPLQNGNSRTLLDVLPSILPPDLQNDPSASQFFRKRIASGGCILLFDGLDEVPTEEEFKAVVNCIESITLAYPKNQCIVTSRIAGWRGGVHADFKVSYLAQLAESQVDSFITIWCDAVEQNAVIGRLQDEGQADKANRRRRALQHATQLRSAIKSNRGMRQLASNPMLLSIIALVHHSLPDLPKERTKLYSECSKILLEQWDMSKGRRVDDTHLRLEQKEAILRRIAFAMHTGEIGKKGGSREAQRSEVEKLLSSLLPTFNMSPKDAERLLTRLIERSGIIVERQRDELAFSHLTFQEYFAASYLAKNKQADFLLQEGRLLTDWWREVAVMYAGLLEDSSDFLRMLYKYDHADLFSTKLLLAGICLGESQVVKQVSIRESICADLAQLRTLSRFTGPASDFRELSGYLTDWVRSSNARRHAVAFAISWPESPEEGETHLKRLEASLRNGDSEEVRLCVSALMLVPESASLELADAICSQLGKRDVKTSTHCLRLLSRLMPSYPDLSMAKAFEIAFDDTQKTVRSVALNIVDTASDSSRLLGNLQRRIAKLLGDEDWSVRQSAAKVYGHYVRAGAAGSVARLFELIDKESDGDVLSSAFDSLRGAAMSDERENYASKLVKLVHGKNEEVRTLALTSLIRLLDIGEGVSSILPTLQEFIGSKAKSIKKVLSKEIGNLSNPVAIRLCIDHFFILVGNGSSREKASALHLLGILRRHEIRKVEIDECLIAGLRSTKGYLKRGSADGIGESDFPGCDDGCYQNLISMAGSRASKTRLSALAALSTTIRPTRRKETLDVLRRGLSSGNSSIRSNSARAASRMGKEGLALKGLLLDIATDGKPLERTFYPQGMMGWRLSGPFFMFAGDYAFASTTQLAVRDAIVSLVSSKEDVQSLVDDISKKIDQSRKPHLALASLIQILGGIAGKYPSPKALECLLKILGLLERSLESIESGADILFFDLPLIPGLDSDSPFQKEVVSAGKHLHGPEVVKLMRRALETQGALTKGTLLNALLEFDPSVRAELVSTIKDLANNDSQRMKDTAWESLQRINFARGAWVVKESITGVSPKEVSILK